MKSDQKIVANRRTIIRSAGMAAAGLGLAGVAGTAGAATGKKHAASHGGSDLGILQAALALEHEGIGAYRIAGGSGLLSKGTLDVALVFLGHHQSHRDALAKLILQAGGKPVDTKSDAEYIQALNLGALKSEADVVKLAAGMEMGAANAYVGQIAAIKDPMLAKLFAQLGSDEAVHWALLNSAMGGSVPKTAFLFG